MARLGIFLPVVVLLAAACGESATDSGVGANATVRDSAGIAIVENGSIEEIAVHELGEPLLDIGAVDGPEEYLLAGAGAVALLDDGGVAIGDRSRTIRYFGPDGTYEGSFGRQGDGPREFQFPRAIWQRSDGSLVVFDARHWRLTVIRDTQLVSTHPVRPPGGNPPASVAMLDDGSVVVHETLFAIPESGFAPMPEIVRRLPPDGQPPDTVLETEGGRMGPIEYSGGSMVAAPLFEADFSASAAADAIYTSDCDEPQYREFTPEGGLERIVRWRTADRAVRPRDVEAARQAALAEDETAAERRRTQEFLDALPVTDRIPACSDLRAGPDGAVWVRAFTSWRTVPSAWHVFLDGELEHTVQFPESTFLVALGTDRFAVVQLDELEVEHVRVYPMPTPRT
ncbi:MAG: hypothetical protein ACODAA_01235 [Gemmatimonadota bacterium]